MSDIVQHFYGWVWKTNLSFRTHYTFVIWLHIREILQHFCEYLTDLLLTINFTNEIENKNSLQFVVYTQPLSCAVHSLSGFTLQFTKNLITQSNINNISCHAEHLKWGIIRILQSRVHAICSDEHYLNIETNNIVSNFSRNSYNRRFIDKAQYSIDKYSQ